MYRKYDTGVRDPFAKIEVDFSSLIVDRKISLLLRKQLLFASNVISTERKIFFSGAAEEEKEEKEKETISENSTSNGVRMCNVTFVVCDG